MPEPAITMYTTPSCSDCYVAKHTMKRLGVSYNEISLIDNPEARAEVERLNDGMRSVPTIILPSGRIVVEPSAWELEAVLRTEGILN